MRRTLTSRSSILAFARVGRNRVIAAAALVGALAVATATAGAGAIANPDATSAQSGDTPKPVLIETAITFPEGTPPRGTVQRLFIGQRSRCARAHFEDEGRASAVIKRIDCGHSGAVTIRFHPRPDGRNQSSSWTLIEATGSFRGLKGGGTMFVRAEQHAPRGQEIFTGTLR
jgi:hypothetical protein